MDKQIDIVIDRGEFTRASKNKKTQFLMQNKSESKCGVIGVISSNTRTTTEL